jgi:hypothetical protein
MCGDNPLGIHGYLRTIKPDGCSGIPRFGFDPMNLGSVPKTTRFLFCYGGNEWGQDIVLSKVRPTLFQQPTGPQLPEGTAAQVFVCLGA